jgi:phage terminase large subunit-like protein
MNPTVKKLLELPPEQRKALLTALKPEELAIVYKEIEAIEKAPMRHWYCARESCNGKPHAGFHWCDHPIDSENHTSFCKHARNPQRPPAVDAQDPWLVWFFSGGRGTGKTRAGAEWILDLVWNQGYRRIALVGRTPADVRDVMIFGDSGIMNCSDPHPKPIHEPSKRRLIWENGAQAFTYSAAAPSQLRGPQHDAAWADELAAWDDANKGDTLDTSWNNLMLGLRLGTNPKCLVTTTPKRVKLVRQLMDRRTTVITNGTTYDNLENLAPSFREQVLTSYEGTRIGQQELEGVLLTDVEGALWSLEMIDRLRGIFFSGNRDTAGELEQAQ